MANLYERYVVCLTVDVSSAEDFNSLASILITNNVSFSVDTIDREDLSYKSFGGLENNDLLSINLGEKRID